MLENNTSKNDASDIIIHSLYGHCARTRKMNNTCGKAMHTGTMDRGFTVLLFCIWEVPSSTLIQSICYLGWGYYCPESFHVKATKRLQPPVLQFSKHRMKWQTLWHYPSFILDKRHDVSETGVCLRHQVKRTPTLLGPIDRASPYLWTTEIVRSWSIKKRTTYTRGR
jgi:hypothetical protein